MMFRKATEKDLPRISEIYDLIHTQEENGLVSIGWIRDVYPTIETASAAIHADEMFVLEEDGLIVASGKINQEQVPEYRYAQWEYPAEDSDVMVLHTLTVDPTIAGRGFGRSFVAFYEDYARSMNCHYLRIDTNLRNQNARRLYSGIGYKEIGVVPCVFNGIPDVQLVCLEKKL